MDKETTEAQLTISPSGKAYALSILFLWLSVMVRMSEKGQGLGKEGILRRPSGSLVK